MPDFPELTDETRSFLAALWRSGGLPSERPVNMYTIGQQLGWDRNHSQDVAMALVAEGLVEIRNLSGGLSLTETGLAVLSLEMTTVGGSDLSLDDIISKIEDVLPGLNLGSDMVDDLKIDLQTLRIQQQRTQPLSEVIKAVTEAITQALEKGPREKVQKLLDSLKGWRQGQ